MKASILLLLCFSISALATPIQGPLSGGIVTSSQIINAGGVTSNGVYTAYDDTIDQSTFNAFPSLDSVDWLNGYSGGGWWYLPSNYGGEYYFNEVSTLNVMNITPIPYPTGTTNCQLTFFSRSLTGGASSFDIQVWVNSGGLQTTFQTNIATGVSQVPQIVNLPVGLTNEVLIIGKFSGFSQFAISNLQVTYSPAPVGAVGTILNAPFKRWNVRADNVSNNSGNGNTSGVGLWTVNFNSIPDYTSKNSSSRSYVPISTDAKNIILEYNSEFNVGGGSVSQLVSVYMDSSAGMVLYTNITVTNNPNISMVPLALPTNKLWTTLYLYNAYNSQGAGMTALMGIYTPSTNTVKYLNKQPSKIVWVCGTSIDCSINQITDFLNGTWQLIEKAFPFKVFNYSSSGGELSVIGQATGLTLTIDSFKRANPDVAWMSIGVNDWDFSTLTTNNFVLVYSNLVMTLHNIKPATLFVLQPPTYTTVTSGNANILGDYQKVEIGLFQQALWTNFVVVVPAATNWLSGAGQLAADNLHPSQAGTTLLANYIGAVLQTNTVNTAGVAPQIVSVPFNIASYTVNTNDIIPAGINQGPPARFSVAVAVNISSGVSTAVRATLMYSNAVAKTISTAAQWSIPAGSVLTETNTLYLMDAQPNSLFWLTNDASANVKEVLGSTLITTK